MRFRRQFLTLSMFIFTIICTGCVTYYIPVQSFKDQFQEVNESTLIKVQVKGPTGNITEYLANPIDEIQCIDKKGSPYILKNSPSIEVRFTDMNNKRTIFYFDRIVLKDTVIIGDISRFLPSKKALSINDISLIEVQEGHKNFKYINKK